MTTSHSFSDLLVNEKPEVITPLDLSEGSTDLFSDKEAGIPALTPIMDSIDGYHSIDWAQVRSQFRAGINNVGVVIAVISEKTHAFGRYLSNV
jgi:hypothetical protein